MHASMIMCNGDVHAFYTDQCLETAQDFSAGLIEKASNSMSEASLCYYFILYTCIHVYQCSALMSELVLAKY